MPIINKKGWVVHPFHYCICLNLIADELLPSRAHFLFWLMFKITKLFSKKSTIFDHIANNTNLEKHNIPFWKKEIIS
jgi:hypothetical protein